MLRYTKSNSDENRECPQMFTKFLKRTLYDLSEEELMG
ncbi:hypothetical protein T11_10072 [Trichinella zimbabwensis]|uniref:Uncharacterized protein n=1 Tax=Trichinella zimbabwensis TaxID=268475 RepID=A0A0V1GD79_9BILA|nr:hypothetical protein T11_10072 [Trichinella zimbabwensis]